MESGNQKKILVADSEFHIIQVLAIKFRKNGFNVFTAQNGRDALELTNKNQPDIIVTDIQMPILSGIKFVEELRANKQTANIPVIMLSARGFTMEDKRKQQLGISVCISKPFSPRELLQTVNEVLDPAVAV